MEMGHVSHVATSTVSWPDEREVAEQLVIGAHPAEARRVLGRVPFWFHTFALNSTYGIYTPGVARDHGYRLASVPDSFAGLSVLDVGAFDGFYSFLAEQRGARRVLAIDNEQYRHWVRDRWNVDLEGAEGFRAIHGLLDSAVEYRRMDALGLNGLDEAFDIIFCWGILHRVEDPLGLLRVLVSRLAEGGQILVETHGIENDAGAGEGAVHVPRPEEVYARDQYVYWKFSSGALRHIAETFDGHAFELHSTPVVDSHPRVVGTIRKG
jgi:tRNA (mo5U34)-methyltransferase